MAEVFTHMATKTLTVTEEAYERLAAHKKRGESFSDVINKLTRKTSLLNLVGILPKKEAVELRRNVKDLRKRMDKEVERQIKSSREFPG